ncbi:DinB family protein [Nocardioides pelophilus]|uniref:DinB family protein n=1 Tax=Nocardioides pelophilus TaxID=2172019 RepID=UPI001604A08E|nr:DinB family protein [Nocardioides pelophilus]
MDAASRTDPPLEADEATTLRAFLDYHRDTLRWKVAGLTQEQLARTLAPSTMTLGGLVKHLALVESNWFEEVLAGGEVMPPFATVDWDNDRDWEWRTAADDTPEELMALFDDAVARADRAVDDAIAKPTGLATPSVRATRKGDRHFSLRWILLHMIEEYARHNGHADLLRESIDGETGE